MKRVMFLLAILVMVLALALTGCKNDQGASDSSTEGGKTSDQESTKNDESNDSLDGEEITLRVVWWGAQTRHDLTLEVIEMFEDKYSNISIEPEFTGFGGYFEKMAAHAAGDNLPDVLQQDYAYIAQYAQRGLLENLDPYVEDHSLDFSNVDENNISGGRVDGDLYGVNLGSNASCIVYDPAMFEETGVSEPTDDWTWEDYTNTLSVLHDKLDIYGDDRFPCGRYHSFNHYLRQQGEAFYSEDQTRLGYDDDKLFEDFFSMEVELVNEGAIASPEERIEITSPETRLIVTEGAAMGSIFSNQFIALSSAAERPLKLALLPKGKDQVREGEFLKPSMFFSVASNSDIKDAAVKLIDFFTNNIEANKVLMAERGIPISSKVREALMPHLGEAQKQTFDYIDLVIKNSSPIDPPNPPGHSEVEKLLSNLGDQMLFKQISPADAAVKFREGANQILAKQTEE